MNKRTYRPVAALLLFAFLVLQIGFTFAAHLSYHADDSVQRVVPSAEVDIAATSAASTLLNDSVLPFPAVDDGATADCAEHCGGAAVVMTRRDPPPLRSRGERIHAPAIYVPAAPPERLERPPKS